ncbi:MAG: hypothetical protein AAFY41_05905, partial [Bacteroidota bacterium]
RKICFFCLMISFQPVILQLIFIAACTSTHSVGPAEISQSKFANVTNVSVSGTDGDYSFRVTITSPDTGCEQYADWWEVVSSNGALIYRRILLHSHVNEQPFTRSGGKVDVRKDEEVWIRAHMNNNGYGGQALKGSIKDGFEKAEFPNELGTSLEQEEPLPDGCNF